MCDWINVKDQLPKDQESVIIACADGVKEAEFWASNTRGNRGKWFFEPPYYGQEQAQQFKKVTHWMHKPSMPCAT